MIRAAAPVAAAALALMVALALSQHLGVIAALALLVDRGEIGWDDKVIEHVPWFRMHDPWVTREITVRDLLVHRSGLGRGAGDLLFVPRSNLSRRGTVERMAHIEPASSFRSTFAYCNVCYVAAGQLVKLGDSSHVDQLKEALTSQDSQGWLIGFVVSLVSVVLENGNARSLIAGASDQSSVALATAMFRTAVPDAPATPPTG